MASKEMFQSPCGDLLIGNEDNQTGRCQPRVVSVPLRGFVDRKPQYEFLRKSCYKQVSVPLRGFVDRKPTEHELSLCPPQVSVPLRGFVDRKQIVARAQLYSNSIVSVTLRGFVDRKLLMFLFTILRYICFSPLAGIC